MSGPRGLTLQVRSSPGAEGTGTLGQLRGTEPGRARKGRGSGGTSPIFLASAHQGEGECGQRGTGRAWCWSEPSPAGSGQACVCQGPLCVPPPLSPALSRPQVRRETAGRPRRGAGTTLPGPPPPQALAAVPGVRTGALDPSLPPAVCPPPTWGEGRWSPAPSQPRAPAPPPRSADLQPPQHLRDPSPALANACRASLPPAGPREGRRDRLP